MVAHGEGMEVIEFWWCGGVRGGSGEGTVEVWVAGSIVEGDLGF